MGFEVAMEGGEDGSVLVGMMVGVFEVVAVPDGGKGLPVGEGDLVLVAEAVENSPIRLINFHK